MASFLARPLALAPKFTRIMSSTSIYANLPESVRDFVASSSKDESHLGQTDAEKKDVSSWISKASDASFASSNTLPVGSESFLQHQIVDTVSPDSIVTQR